jgi:hypothetical protein
VASAIRLRLLDDEHGRVASLVEDAGIEFFIKSLRMIVNPRTQYAGLEKFFCIYMEKETSELAGKGFKHHDTCPC